MKLNIIGFEITEGISHKTGKPVPYSIGKLHCVLPIQAFASKKEGARSVTKGGMGAEYSVEVSVIDKIAHLAPPMVCEAEMQDVMMFGERKQQIVSLVPVTSNTQAPSREVAKA